MLGEAYSRHPSQSWVFLEKTEEDGPSDKRECSSIQSSLERSLRAGQHVTPSRAQKQPSGGGARMGRGSAGKRLKIK